MDALKTQDESMQPLMTTLNDHAEFFNASPAVQLFGSSRQSVQAPTLIGLLNAGWLTDLNERSLDSMGDRPLLLTYLGTHASSLKDAGTLDAPITQATLDQELEHQSYFPAKMARTFSANGDVARRMMDLGADPFAQDKEGRDSLDQTFALGWFPLIQELLVRQDRPSVERLIERTTFVAHVNDPRAPKGKSLHSFSSFSATGMEIPWLHAAIAHGHHPLAERLLGLGFSLEQPDQRGRTPLFYAQHNETAQWLLGQGANPLHTDEMGQTAGQAWQSLVVKTKEMKAMNATMKKALGAALKNSPEVLRAQQVSTLFDAAIKETKATVLHFIKSNGLSVDEERLDPATGRPQSLIAHVALHAIEHHERSRAILSHLFERTERPSMESLEGVPDVWLVHLASSGAMSGNEKLPGLVYEAMHRHYGIDPIHMNEDDLTQRMGRWIDDERNLYVRTTNPADLAILPLARTQRPTPMATVFTHAFQTLLRRSKGYKRLQGPVDEAWDRLENATLRALAERTPLGVSRAWDHLNTLSVVMLQEKHELSCLDQAARQLAAIPGIPWEPLMVNVGIAQLGMPRSQASYLTGTGIGQRLKAPFEKWGETLIGGMVQKALEAGVRVDTSWPGFQEHFARLQAHQPVLANLLETHVLKQASAPSMNDLTSSNTDEIPITPTRRRL